MATATLISPTSTHYGHPSLFSSSGYNHAAPGPSIAGMISPIEPRRPSDELETPHRQSLPSLSEVISGAKPSSYPPSQASNVSGQQSFPSPFAPGPPRSYAESTEKNSPRPPHHASTYPPRQEALPAMSDPPRPPPFAGRPPAPLSSFSAAQPNLPHKPENMRESDPRAAEPVGPYAQHPPPPPPTTYPHPHPHPHPHPSQLPPGQVPLPAYPVSPRHGGPPLPSAFDAQRSAAHADETEYGPARPQYDRTLNRHLDAWGYQDCLSRIAGATRTIYNFAEAYGRIAAEQHGGHPLPDRLPTEREVNDMLDNVDYIRNSLDSVRQLVKESNERVRAAGKQKGYEDEDTPMYDGMNKNNYGITEVKKRRGRAAPPGRCHSCNRIDTPEWRRGPDGARTLCNACGLHYAKLERKRQLEARQIRPKPSDERS
ncbi:GATA zinc finger protein [Colletotrichum sublineola]|uniref:Putative GATA zinc finger n=1 Tax=Colletotrichum sublineola TaxID=1173701 RepID=A0A066WWV9_COLSU|nr:GATA zinc finger protein [Colletotrichum sublineola]KDN59914.1 putative GATA zinc finger [Colletotrichum sublineola]